MTPARLDQLAGLCKHGAIGGGEAREMLAEITRLRNFILEHTDYHPDFPPVCALEGCNTSWAQACDHCEHEEAYDFCSRKCMIQWLWDCSMGDEESFMSEIEYYELDGYALMTWPPVWR